MVAPDHDLFSGVNLAPLLDAYRNAATASRYFLDVLQRMPHSRKPDVLQPPLSLAGLLESRFGVPETGALELGRLCMLAHGHPDEELEEMRNRDKIRDGKFRKRKNASQQKISSMEAKVLRDPNTKRPIELKSI